MTKFEMKGTSNLMNLIGRMVINPYGETEQKETFEKEVKMYQFPDNYLFSKTGFGSMDFATVKLTNITTGQVKNYICSLNDGMDKKTCYKNVLRYIEEMKLDWEVEYGYN